MSTPPYASLTPDREEVRFADPVIPPELPLARQRTQLAGQLRNTYAEEKRAPG